MLPDEADLEECKRRANLAAAEGRWTQALEWTRRAKALTAPEAELLADEGEYLYKIGRFEEALAVLLQADALDKEGYTAWRAAEAAQAAGKARDEVMALLVRALEKSPDLVGDLGSNIEFVGLRDMPGFPEMVAKAYDRLGIRLETGDLP